ncbi:CAP-Gly domain-containing linker protein 1-like [Mytilus edulis]|uniref:CAP-Gly domain-containing linker protein 1-like n=1 Tax=Mytilus edulis TaxID=6550 RepID=UPI0039F09874
MFFIQFICISISMIGILAISLGSESESLLSCSKFHFEEKVLEKMIRLENKMEVYAEKIKLWEESVSSKLEHKMEVYAEKVKLWEDSVSSSLNKVTEAMKQTETFVDSMRGAHLLDQTRFNNSFVEVKDQTKSFFDSMRDANLQAQTQFNDSFNEVQKQTETFVDSMRNAHLQDQTRFNDSFLEVKKQAESFVDSMRDAHLLDQTRFNDSFLEVKKQTETFVDSMRNAHLQDQTRFNDSFLEVKKQTEAYVESMRDAHLQDQTRFNDSFIKVRKQTERLLESMRDANLLDQTRFNDSIIEVKKQTEIFIESMRNAHLQDQTRFNNSFFETIARFEMQSANETEFNKRQMNSLLDSFSSKVQELSEAERKRDSTTKLSLRQEQNRFNKSFDKIAEDFQVRFNKYLQEVALKQQKVALTACATSSTVPGGTVVHFPNIQTNIGITNLSAYKSTGKFVCTVAGLYHVSAVMMSSTDGQYYYIYKNSDRMITTYYGKVHSYVTRTSVFVTMLDVGDEITVWTAVSQYIYEYSCFTIVKLN